MQKENVVHWIDVVNGGDFFYNNKFISNVLTTLVSRPVYNA